MAEKRVSVSRVSVLLVGAATLLLGIAWAWSSAASILALNGDCQAVLDAYRFSAYVRLAIPDDGVEVVERGLAGPRRPDGGPWLRVARPIADCFPERMEGNRLTLAPGQSSLDFVTNIRTGITVIQFRKPGQHPDASWPYPFNSEAGECVYSEVLRLQSQADASFPDSFCGVSWWAPMLWSWLVEGLLPALGLFAAVWFLASRVNHMKPRS